jgi:hypothetical protein
MVSAEYQQVDLSQRRKARRTQVAADAKVSGDMLGSALCKIVDISTHGSRIETYSELSPNADICLRIPPNILVDAKVVWTNGYVSGCQFLKPIAEDLLEAVFGILPQGRAHALTPDLPELPPETPPDHRPEGFLHGDRRERAERAKTRRPATRACGGPAFLPRKVPCGISAPSRCRAGGRGSRTSPIRLVLDRLQIVQYGFADQLEVLGREDRAGTCRFSHGGSPS